jgi:hypothetical protein
MAMDLTSGVLLTFLPFIVLAVLAAGFIGFLLFLAARFVSSQRRIAQALERLEKHLGQR